MPIILHRCRSLVFFLFYIQLYHVKCGNQTSTLLGTTPSPITGCTNVFRNSSVVFTNPRAGKLSGLTLKFISDVGFNRSSKIFLKLPGFTRLDGSSGVRFISPPARTRVLRVDPSPLGRRATYTSVASPAHSGTRRPRFLPSPTSLPPRSHPT